MHSASLTFGTLSRVQLSRLLAHSSCRRDGRTCSPRIGREPPTSRKCREQRAYSVHGSDAFPSATSAGYERLDATAPRLALIAGLRD